MAQFNVTELDYDKIKANLIDHFKKLPGDKYKDYDFEGSGLNIMMDILAYNTHYNAIHAHTAVNETFLDSAQLRHNVVSRAKLLGYTPNSIRAASCTCTLIFDESVTDTGNGLYDDKLILQAGQTVKTGVGGKSFIFRTIEDKIASRENGQYTFENVVFYQGNVKSQKFVVRDQLTENQKYVLKDTTADTSHLKVKVFNHSKSDSFSVYRGFRSFSNIESDSRIYFISENYSGHHEVEFGNGVYGKRPTGQNIIEFEYLSTQGDEANGARQFEWVASAQNISPISNPIVTSIAAGGSIKEDIESIRFNAPLTYAAQDRAVTVNDYQGIIRNEFSNSITSSVWGGQHNDPPKYGTVFVCAYEGDEDSNNALLLTKAQKSNLIGILSSKNVASTTVEVVDPEFTFLLVDIIFKYDPSLTNKSGSALETSIKRLLTEYNTTILQNFNTVFRYSNFLNAIDKADDSIISSTVRLSAYKRKSLSTSEVIPSTFNFGYEVHGDILEADSFITSDEFKYGDYVLRLKDEPLSSTTRRVYAYRLDELEKPVKVINSVGILNPLKGTIEFDPISAKEDTTINIYCIPASYDVVAKRNTILRIDDVKSNIVADIDTIRTGGSAGAADYKTYNRYN